MAEAEAASGAASHEITKEEEEGVMKGEATVATMGGGLSWEAGEVETVRAGGEMGWVEDMREGQVAEAYEMVHATASELPSSAAPPSPAPSPPLPEGRSRSGGKSRWRIRKKGSWVRVARVWREARVLSAAVSAFSRDEPVSASRSEIPDLNHATRDPSHAIQDPNYEIQDPSHATWDPGQRSGINAIPPRHWICAANLAATQGTRGAEAHCPDTLPTVWIPPYRSRWTQGWTRDYSLALPTVWIPLDAGMDAGLLPGLLPAHKCLPTELLPSRVPPRLRPSDGIRHRHLLRSPRSRHASP